MKKITAHRHPETGRDNDVPPALLMWHDLAAERISVDEGDADPLSARYHCPPWCKEAREHEDENPDAPFVHPVRAHKSARVCASGVARVSAWKHGARWASRDDDTRVVEPSYIEVELIKSHGFDEPYVQLYHSFRVEGAKQLHRLDLRLEEAAHLASVLAAAVSLAQSSGGQA